MLIRIREGLASIKTLFLIGPIATLHLIREVYKLRAQGVRLFLLDSHKLADDKYEEDDLLS